MQKLDRRYPLLHDGLKPFTAIWKKEGASAADARDRKVGVPEVSTDGRLSELQKAFVISLICLALYYYPLIDVRYFFLDDVGRSLEGYSWYTSAGRPLADFLLSLLTPGELLTDVAPAPQIIGILALSLAAALLAVRLRISSPVSIGLFALLMGGTPYFLENMSFRFDAGGMALGVLCSVAPFWFLRTGRPLEFWRRLFCSLQPFASISRPSIVTRSLPSVLWRDPSSINPSAPR